MCAKWLEESPNDLIFEKINKHRKVSKGLVSFSSLLPQYYTPVLVSALSFNKEISEHDKNNLVRKALFSQEILEPLTPDNFINKLEKLEVGFLKLETKDFKVCTSLSIKGKLPFKTIKILNTLIKFDPGRELFPKTFVSLFKRHFPYELPKDYLPISIVTKARNEEEAIEKALRAVNVLQGLWNLQFSPTFRLTLPMPGPTGVVSLGPIHSLYYKNNKMFEDWYWYEKDYRGPKKLKNISKDDINTKRLRGFTLDAARLIKNKKRYSYLIDSLIIYTEASETDDFEKAFIKFWTALELLTFTKKGNSIETLRRASFLIVEYKLARQILEHLKEKRNFSVHTNKGLSKRDMDMEVLVFQLKQFVNTLLYFHLFRASEFEGNQEIENFLDLNPDSKLLEQKRKLISKAIKYHQ